MTQYTEKEYHVAEAALGMLDTARKEVSCKGLLLP